MSTKLTDDQFLHIAKLSRLTIKPDEYFIKDQLSQAADYIQILNELKTDNISPTFQLNHKKNTLRKDDILPSLSQNQALSQASKVKNGYFVTEATIPAKVGSASGGKK